MPDLERELRELGRAIEYPPTPDVASAVRRRLVAQPLPRRLPARRTLVLAFAALAVAVGAAMAVPQARTAILEWLGLRGVRIERVPTQPTAPANADLGLGERVSLAEARRRAAFEVLAPSALELEGAEVYFAELASGGMVSFVAGQGDDNRLLLTQFAGSLEPNLIEKSAGPGTRIEETTVNGGRAFWLEGARHEFFYVDERGEPVPETLRLAGNTLLWERGELTLRLEGESLTKEEALRIARSVR